MTTLPATRLVSALFGTLKVFQMYGRRHDATANAVTNLAAALRETAGEGSEVVVEIRGHRLVVDDALMRSSECGALALSFLVEELRRRGIARIRLPAGLTDPELSSFASAFLDLDLATPDPAARLSVVLRENECARIQVEALEERSEDPVVMEERRQIAMRSYLRGLRAFQEVLRQDGVEDRSKVYRARRAVHGLVDRFLENENAVLALAQIRGHDERLFHHSLNVCVYALLIGQHLGMSRKQLGELGMAALFHDFGKTAEPAEPVADSDDARMKEGFQALREHPVRGARALLRTGTLHEGLLKSAIAAFEHHVHVDGSGFPRIDYPTHLVTRIISIADCYESLTSTRSFRESPYSHADAFSLMAQKAGTLFDPLLLKVFVNSLGIHPVGTIVRLDSGEVAMVVEGPCTGAAMDRPRVRVVQRDGGRLDPTTVLDLTEKDESGSYAHSVVATLPPQEVFESVGEYVAAAI